ncbi:MAG: hypothetical protein HOE16_05485 [Lentimicrobiaceae bacterium]|jgi:hypothetical protein|nr:hypothetical protein [Lentimicrobiaceae bacterium]MBT4190633.1 hypothetical protein [Lentimicrobiaceae bacterium]MBT4801502.1 hypothetical protein [Lentimicrobiaceae bacterium]MBT5164207.1 hypothetical protein [Lentimicrobiaceae bacterium]MBT5669998.1 hypothetical protein [Lentimicrobiaceae bacterium]
MYINNLQYLIQYAPRVILSQSNSGITIYKGQKLKTDFIIDFLNPFYEKYILSKNDKPIKLRLSGIILQKKYHTYTPYLNYLIDEGYIIKSRNHFKGKRCNEYKFIKNMESCEFEEYLNYDSSLHKRLLKFYNDPSNFKSSPVIDEEVLKFTINNLRHINLNYKNAKSFLDDFVVDKKKYLKNLSSIRKIKHNHIYANPDGYGRLHTNFTILKKEIRHEYLTIDGEIAKEIDIKNSQPFFLLKLMSVNMNLIGDAGDDLMTYHDEVIKGNLYEYIQKHTDKQNRSEAKRWIYKVLFGNTYVEYDDFNMLFPTVYRFLKAYKTRFGYKELSHKLQRIESNFIFNKVCKKLMDLGIIFFTVHDSVCVKTSDFMAAKNIFDNEMNIYKTNLKVNLFRRNIN